MTDRILELELLQHAAALRKMARALVGVDDADDLVQETTLRVLRKPPARPTQLGGLLLTILRQLASKLRRGERRRQGRERAAARSEAVAAADHHAASHEIVERVLRALLALPAPYRDTLLQRFFEDRGPSQIAERNGVSVETVKTRQKRGLAMLRERLDGQGATGDWRSSLVGVFGLGGDATASVVTGVTGVMVMGMATKLSCAAVAVLLAAGAFWSFGTGTQPALPLLGDSGAGPASPVSQRDVVASTSDSPRQESRTSVGRHLVVTTTSGQRLPDASAWTVRPGSRLLRVSDVVAGSGPDGVMDLAGVPPERQASTLVVGKAGYYSRVVGPSNEVRSGVVVALEKAAPVAVHVTHAGAGLPGVVVAASEGELDESVFDSPEDLLGLHNPLRAAVHVATTNEAGVAALDLSVGKQYLMKLRKEGYVASDGDPLARRMDEASVVIEMEQVIGAFALVEDDEVLMSRAAYPGNMTIKGQCAERLSALAQILMDRYEPRQTVAMLGTATSEGLAEYSPVQMSLLLARQGFVEVALGVGPLSNNSEPQRIPFDRSKPDRSGRVRFSIENPMKVEGAPSNVPRLSLVPDDGAFARRQGGGIPVRFDRPMVLAAGRYRTTSTMRSVSAALDEGRAVVLVEAGGDSSHQITFKSAIWPVRCLVENAEGMPLRRCSVNCQLVGESAGLRGSRMAWGATDLSSMVIWLGRGSWRIVVSSALEGEHTLTVRLPEDAASLGSQEALIVRQQVRR